MSAPVAIDDRISPSHPRSNASLAGIRVLVVDDEPDSLDLVAFVLEQAGAKVQTATSGLEALARWAESTLDILVSDIGMPEMDGYALIQQIRASDEAKMISAGASLLPKAIALTAYAGEMDAQRAKEAGFQEHLAKPVQPDLLISTIHGLCQKISKENL